MSLKCAQDALSLIVVACSRCLQTGDKLVSLIQSNLVLQIHILQLLSILLHLLGESISWLDECLSKHAFAKDSWKLLKRYHVLAFERGAYLAFDDLSSFVVVGSDTLVDEIGQNLLDRQLCREHIVLAFEVSLYMFDPHGPNRVRMLLNSEEAIFLFEKLASRLLLSAMLYCCGHCGWLGLCKQDLRLPPMHLRVHGCLFSSPFLSDWFNDPIVEVDLERCHLFDLLVFGWVFELLMDGYLWYLFI